MNKFKARRHFQNPSVAASTSINFAIYASYVFSITASHSRSSITCPTTFKSTYRMPLCALRNIVFRALSNISSTKAVSSAVTNSFTADLPSRAITSLSFLQQFSIWRLSCSIGGSSLTVAAAPRNTARSHRVMLTLRPLLVQHHMCHCSPSRSTDLERRIMWLPGSSSVEPRLGASV